MAFETSRIIELSDKFHFLDNDFPKRVLKTSIIVSFFLALFSVSFWSLEITLGLSIGMAISIGLMHFLWWMTSVIFPAVVKGDIENKQRKVKFSLIFFNILKYLLVSAGLFFILRYVPINLLAFFIGISIVQIILASKISSVLLVNYINRSIKPDLKKRPS